MSSSVYVAGTGIISAIGNNISESCLYNQAIPQRNRYKYRLHDHRYGL